VSTVASSFETARSRLLGMRSETLMVRSREAASPDDAPHRRANHEAPALHYARREFVIVRLHG